ncbi:MotA/TolQ/ExbB proton channel family protein [Leptospira sp. GIMC2001]|uniref:MotA/TolQ/ExbB proton channel family protein n=1 Tax=Leptospira sp. GIMC2001 TaxID=1513297 RepID=UPI00234BCDE8|nr:MotA/TolQ/ExbB proton channel family protein [Leptospira sp. GIMC2001]WCL48681.1 MotA/TolQ/ExbB proton channel family protein [Leptospira sp. GIMC2001]
MNEFVDLGEKLIFVVMGLASILAVAVFLERYLVYRKNTTDAAKGTMESFVDSIRDGNPTNTLENLAAQQDSVYTRFIRFGLFRIGDKKESLQEMLMGRVISEKIKLEERLPILNTLGNNAPFIGLLGTVLGVIKAFYGLGTMGNAGAEVVMRSISTALLATACGLAVAIPVVMANNYFSRKMKVIIQNLEIISHEFLAFKERG